MQRTQEARRTVVVVVLVVLVVLGAAVAGPWHVTPRGTALPQLGITMPPRPTQTQTSPPAELTGDANQVSAPDWVLYLVLALLLGLLTWYLAPKVRRALTAWSARSEAVAEAGDPGDVVGAEVLPATPVLEQGVARAARFLEDDRVPPGDAVIAAWVALEESAARSGVVRDRAQTASEFTLDVLDATQADAAATRRLLSLYLAARYSEHRLTAADVATARDALTLLADGVAHLRRADA